MAHLKWLKLRYTYPSRSPDEKLNSIKHVQSFVEADVTDLWDWREKVKNQFQSREGEKLTFTCFRWNHGANHWDLQRTN